MIVQGKAAFGVATMNREIYMGRIKITAVKNLANELIDQFGDRFSTDFEKNKTAVNEVKEVKSKKTRNVLAGYITRQMQKIKKTGL